MIRWIYRPGQASHIVVNAGGYQRSWCNIAHYSFGTYGWTAWTHAQGKPPTPPCKLCLKRIKEFTVEVDRVANGPLRKRGKE